MATNFNIPTDVFPYSTSYAGLPEDFRTGFLSTLMPQLKSSIEGMPGNIDKYTQNALNAYKGMTGTAMKEAMPGLLNQLAGRNVLDSTVTSDAIGKTMRDIIGGYGAKGYETAMEGARMKAGMPQVLGNLAQLGQYSGGFQADPLAPYNTMANLIRGLM